MNAPRRLRRQHRGPFTPGLTAGLVAGVALNLAGLICIGATWRLPAPPPPERVFVTVGADTARAREFAELLDPSPLFLPTRLNHGAGAVRADRGTPEAPPIPDNLAEPLAVGARLATSAPAAAVIGPAGVAGACVPDTFACLGLAAPTVPAQGRPRCIVTNESTGKPAVIAEIALRRDERDLPPAEFLVEIDDYGIQSPALLSGTGDAAVDLALNDALMRALRTKPPAPGRYRVCVAP